METSNRNIGAGLASRAVAFAAALFTTLFILTGTAVVFTGSALIGA